MRLLATIETFHGRYRVDENGCWVWSGARDRHGYGKFGHNSALAHRWSYENFVGPIPAGLHLDHLCRVRACVNPAHLEPVTNAENVRRRNEQRTHCIRGHAFDDENTYRSKGRRACRACGRMHAHNAALRKRQAVTP